MCVCEILLTLALLSVSAVLTRLYSKTWMNATAHIPARPILLVLTELMGLIATVTLGGAS